MTDQIDKLRTLNGELCAEINEKDRRIRELESLVRDMWFKNIGRMDSCGWCVIGCDDAEHCELQERIAALGVEVDA